MRVPVVSCAAAHPAMLSQRATKTTHLQILI
jgi:hypothetical protein